MIVLLVLEYEYLATCTHRQRVASKMIGVVSSSNTNTNTIYYDSSNSNSNSNM
jgi:hypothetical protein